MIVFIAAALMALIGAAVSWMRGGKPELRAGGRADGGRAAVAERRVTPSTRQRSPHAPSDAEDVNPRPFGTS